LGVEYAYKLATGKTVPLAVAPIKPGDVPLTGATNVAARKRVDACAAR
jgi:hypothetical protein